MELDEITQISKKLEESYFEYHPQMFRLFYRLYEIYQESNNTEKVTQTKWECELFAICPQSYFVENSQGWFLPDAVSHFSDDQVRYYCKRLKEAKNPFLLCQYSQYLFEHDGNLCELNRFEVGKIVIENLLQKAELIRINGSCVAVEFSVIDALNSAIEAAFRLRNAELVKKVLKPIDSYLVEIMGNKKYRWLLELSEIYRNAVGRKFLKIEEKEEINSLLTGLEEARDHYWNEDPPNLHLYRGYCEELISWVKLQDSDEEEIKKLQLDIGRSFEEEAINQQGREEKSKLVEAAFYEAAMNHYRNIGESEKVSEMKVKVKKSYKDSFQKGEFKTVMLSAPLSEEVVERFFSRYPVELDLNEAIDRLATDSLLIPDLEKIKQGANQEHGSMLSFLKNSMVNPHEGNKIYQETDEVDKVEKSVARLYGFHLQFIHGNLLFPLFDAMEKERNLRAKNIVEKICSWPMLDSKNAPLITAGIDRYFEDDFVSAIHVLTPQLESTIRRAFSKAGMAVTSIKKGMAQHEETFTVFLERPDVIDKLGPNFHQYLSYAMVDQLGFNIRNDVAHGLISPEHCNKAVSLIIIHLFLCLTSVNFD